MNILVMAGELILPSKPFVATILAPQHWTGEDLRIRAMLGLVVAPKVRHALRGEVAVALYTCKS